MASYPPIMPENGSSFTSIIHRTSYPFIRTARHEGHRVLITGGAGGIGRSIALAFARAGAKAAAAADISESFGQLASDIYAAARENGHDVPQVVLTQVDVKDEDSVRHCAHLVACEFDGRLDVLVNNAGYMTPPGAIPASDAATWWRTMEVNLKGAYLTSKHFIPLLLASGAGPTTVVNISSVAALNLRPLASAYGTSQLAVLRLAEFLNVEAGARGLLAYSVHPGEVLTDLATQDMPPEALASLGDSAELVADTVAWLSAERREWLAGRYISATWDMGELLARSYEIVEGDKLKVRLVI
ncbi:oxidoreductase-like protein [Hypoxylon sp. NC1633]|nr:oxidoreductase-like protein [Hypoxylon sp. NC1633]